MGLFWPLAPAINTGSSLGTVVPLCHGGPGALDLQDRTLHMLQQITDGVDVGAANSNP